jgi:hypothetical protein
MPEALDYDKETGVIRSGRFVGQHIDGVMAYLHSLEDAMAAGQSSTTPSIGTSPEAPPQPPRPKTPQEELATASAERMGSLHLFTAQRLEQEDEAAFVATVTEEEFAKYKPKIDQLKASCSIEQRMSKGLHKLLYMNLKMQEPEFQKRVFGPEAPPVPSGALAEGEGEGEGETPPAGNTPPAAAPPVPATPPAAPPVTGAQPVPPAAPASLPPTPAARSSAPQPRKPKLKATPKAERLAREYGMAINEYLLLLEDRGTTQAELEAVSIRKEDAPGRRRSVYDRSVAS